MIKEEDEEVSEDEKVPEVVQIEEPQGPRTRSQTRALTSKNSVEPTRNYFFFFFYN
jgi:hypothetical protein